MQNLQGIPVPAWPYEGTPDDLLGVDHMPDEIPVTNTQPMASQEPVVEPEPVVVVAAPPMIKRQSERIKQIIFNMPPSPGPGLTPDDAMVIE